MCDYDLRKTIVENGLYKRYAKARRNTFKQSKGESFEGETLNDFECYLAKDYNDVWFKMLEECERIGNTSYQRVKRLKQRVKMLLDGGVCLFLTLTFNDDTMAKTTQEERRNLVLDYLKKTMCPFVGNIDFGKENEREHYHAVIRCEKVDYTLWHQNGAIKGEKVRLRGNSETKLAKYIDKLALHSLKDTTHHNRLLYSTERIAL